MGEFYFGVSRFEAEARRFDDFMPFILLTFSISLCVLVFLFL